jgi:hypothetical protein
VGELRKLNGGVREPGGSNARQQRRNRRGTGRERQPAASAAAGGAGRAAQADEEVSNPAGERLPATSAAHVEELIATPQQHISSAPEGMGELRKLNACAQEPAGGEWVCPAPHLR